MAEQNDHGISSARFLRASSLYGLEVVFGQLMSLLLFPLYVQTLSIEDYGVLEILRRSRDLLFILISTAVGATTVAFYQFEKSESGRLRVIGTALASGIASVALLLVISLPFAGWGSRTLFGSNEYTTLMALMVIVTAADLAHKVPLACWMARLDAGKNVFFGIAIPLTRTLLILYMVLVRDAGLLGIVQAWAINSSVYAVLLTSLIVWQIGLRNVVPDVGRLKRMMSYGLPFLPNSVFSFIIRNGDRYVLLNTFGKAMTGLYGAGYRVGSLLEVGLTVPFAKVWAPTSIRLARDGDPSKMQKLGRMANAFLFIYGLAAVSFLAIAFEFLDLLATDEYIGAIVIVPLVVLAYYFDALIVIFDASIYVSKKTSFKPLVTGIGTAVVVSLYLLLIPRFDMIGAAVATVFGYAVMVVVTAIIGRRVYPIPFRYGSALLIPLFAALCVSSSLIRSYPNFEIPWVEKGAIIAGFIVLCLLFRVLRPADVREIIQLIRNQVSDRRKAEH